jgi:hypothetical protein
MKELLARARAVPVPAPVAIHENAASARAAWMLGSWQDGRTWPNRLTSYEAEHSSSAASREGWAAALRAASIPYRFVGPSALEPGSLAAAGVRCLVLREALALSDAELAAMEAFVREGGLLVADENALLFDEKLRGRDGAALEKLLGARRPEGRAIEEVAAEVDRRVPRRAAAGTSRVERSLGAGATLHLDRRVGARLDRTSAVAEACELGTEIAARLEARSVDASPRLALGAAGRARLHRFRVPAAESVPTDAEEIAVVAATAPAASPFETSLLFDRDVEVERLEPEAAAPRRVRASEPFPVAVDDRHVAILRIRAAR